MRELTRFRVFAGVLVLLFVFVIFAGCAKRGSTISSEYADSETATEGDEPGPLYYDFGDVLVPLELEVNEKDSFVMTTSGFTAGVLVLTGRVDVGSLIRFFENNMAKDNWRFLSSFKSPRTILLFEKQNRVCVIYLTDREYKVNVEIWVAPAVEDAVSGLLK